MVDFKTIGRADPIGTIKDWQAKESNLATQQSNRAVNDLRMQTEQLKIDDTQRKIAAQKKQREDDIAPLPWEVVSTKFMGAGEKGSPAELITQVATQYGLRDMSQGGDGTTSKHANRQIMQLFLEPQMATKLSRTRINFSRAKLVAAKEMLAKKPDDQNAAASYQKWSDELKRSLGADKDIATGIKMINDQKAKAKQDYTLGDTRYSGETNKSIATNPKADSGNGKPKLTEYRQWYKDGSSEAMRRIFANKPEKQSEIKIFLDALDSGDMEVAKETEDKLTQAMAPEQYQLYQDNIKDFFGREGVPQSIRKMFEENVGAEKEQELPNPSEYSGQTIKYPNGDRFKSDGENWEKLNG